MDFQFPPIPTAKTYGTKTTPEQDVVFKLVQSQPISNDEENILNEAIKFYEEAFEYLKSINLSEVTDDDAEKIKEYLKTVFNFKITVQNKITFQNVFSVTLARDEFLESGKIRNTDFISYPPQHIIEKLGVSTVEQIRPNQQFFIVPSNWCRCS